MWKFSGGRQRAPGRLRCSLRKDAWAASGTDRAANSRSMAASLTTAPGKRKPGRRDRVCCCSQAGGGSAGEMVEPSEMFGQKVIEGHARFLAPFSLHLVADRRDTGIEFLLVVGKAELGAAPAVPYPVEFPIIAAGDDRTVLVAQGDAQMSDDLFCGPFVVTVCVLLDILGIHRCISHVLPLLSRGFCNPANGGIHSCRRM